ncbi:hypothetical protein UFOVP1610_49 [uncultured Caudovirales phage]|uniref:Uncharacterized protein n=1 Tax=uncultured Caudovirales phage TaxID=2100421 RepID=A0A6J5STY2_9CAUD|nr:hypothetical protein UFOVP1610_49 [uncultured Caudovirales phage]
MTKEEIIKALRDMARYPTVTLPRDSEALKVAADLLAQPDPYAKGYADAMNWKVQNHLEHLPAAQPEQEPVAWVDLLKEAQQIVESKVLYKKFIAGTPLSNDIACWMAAFAQQHTTPPQQEPVKLVSYNCKCGRTMNFESVHGVVAPQRTWVGLTDEEINDIAKNYALNNPTTPLHFARAIEAKLKERNHEN